MDTDEPDAPHSGTRSGESSTPAAHVDAIGHLCPAPVLEARKALERMQAGEMLEILTDDPLAELDFQVFCDRTGHALVSSLEDGSVRTTRIIKRAEPRSA